MFPPLTPIPYSTAIKVVGCAGLVISKNKTKRGQKEFFPLKNIFFLQKSGGILKNGKQQFLCKHTRRRKHMGQIGKLD